MKPFISILVLAMAAIMFSGCASQEAYDSYSGKQLGIAEKYYEAAKEPLVNLTLPAPDGGEYKLVVNREVDPIILQQIKDSEWVAPVQGLISTVGMVGGAYVIMDGAGNHTENIGGDSVTGYQSNPITTTTEVVPVAE